MTTDRTQELLDAMSRAGIPTRVVEHLPDDHPTLSGGIAVPGVCYATARHGEFLIAADDGANDCVYPTAKAAATRLAQLYRGR